jgi:hypothetical protein
MNIAGRRFGSLQQIGDNRCRSIVARGLFQESPDEFTDRRR